MLTFNVEIDVGIWRYTALISWTIRTRLVDIVKFVRDVKNMKNLETILLTFMVDFYD